MTRVGKKYCIAHITAKSEIKEKNISHTHFPFYVITKNEFSLQFYFGESEHL
jgi:hypothetical protein